MKIKCQNFLVFLGESAGAILLGSVPRQRKSMPANAGSSTPWGTVLSAKETFQAQMPEAVYGDATVFHPSKQAFALENGEYDKTDFQLRLRRMLYAAKSNSDSTDCWIPLTDASVNSDSPNNIKKSVRLPLRQRTSQQKPTNLLLRPPKVKIFCKLGKFQLAPDESTKDPMPY